jgi:hypothetical protein
MFFRILINSIIKLSNHIIRKSILLIFYLFLLGKFLEKFNLSLVKTKKAFDS